MQFWCRKPWAVEHSVVALYPAVYIWYILKCHFWSLPLSPSSRVPVLSWADKFVSTCHSRGGINKSLLLQMNISLTPKHIVKWFSFDSSWDTFILLYLKQTNCFAWRGPQVANANKCCVNLRLLQLQCTEDLYEKVHSPVNGVLPPYGPWNASWVE